MVKDKTTLSLTFKNKATLNLLTEEKVFKDMRDGFKFAVSLAVVKKHIPIHEKLAGDKETFINIGTLDPDKALADSVKALHPNPEEAIYSFIEKLADWGIEKLQEYYNENNGFDLADFINENS
jgi:hypothetical protein